MAQVLGEQRVAGRSAPLEAEVAPTRWDSSLQLDTTERIVTPENIAFDYYCAGPFVRIAAFIIDVLVYVVAWFAWLFIEWMGFVLISILAVQLGLGGAVDDFALVIIGINLLVAFVTYWLVWGWAESRFNGRTLGKLVLGIRVVSTTGHPISGMQAMARSLLRAVEVMPILMPYHLVTLFVAPREMVYMEPEVEEILSIVGFPTGIVAFLCLFVLPRFQRIGDVVAGTMVIYDHRKRKPGLAKLEDTRTSLLAEYIPASFRPRREMVKAISTYVHRRNHFTAYRRNEIAAHLAKPLLVEFGMLPDTSYDLLLCAIYYKLFVAEGNSGAKANSETSSSPTISNDQGGIL